MVLREVPIAMVALVATAVSTLTAYISIQFRAHLRISFMQLSKSGVLEYRKIWTFPRAHSTMSIMDMWTPSTIFASIERSLFIPWWWRYTNRPGEPRVILTWSVDHGTHWLIITVWRGMDHLLLRLLTLSLTIWMDKWDRANFNYTRLRSVCLDLKFSLSTYVIWQRLPNGQWLTTVVYVVRLKR